MKWPLFNDPEVAAWELVDLLHNIEVIDIELGNSILGCWRPPDLTIAPDGSPYLYRWHVVKSDKTNIFFHIQVADDPERPLHDHPWDNMSVILSGAYDEILEYDRITHEGGVFVRRAGDTIFRKAEWGHRLLIGEDVPYTMTLFSTGSKIRRWGFWYPKGWVDAEKVCRLDGNVSTHIHGAP
ncbi:MAG TPA: hypothetical protein VNU19_07145 [Candidatus Acidoferrum sp.]|jgi:hypothetical protein|nr:hypothetical protein [Candidatus Acidoferrum sp.]